MQKIINYGEKKLQHLKRIFPLRCSAWRSSYSLQIDGLSHHFLLHLKYNTCIYVYIATISKHIDRKSSGALQKNIYLSVSGRTCQGITSTHVCGNFKFKHKKFQHLKRCQKFIEKKYGYMYTQ